MTAKRRAWADKRGKSREAQGYGRAHRKMREHLLATVILCEECTRRGRVTAGTHADHIVSLAKGGTHERDNYQLLCAPCHSRKSLIEQGKRVKRAFGPDGWPIEE